MKQYNATFDNCNDCPDVKRVTKYETDTNGKDTYCREGLICSKLGKVEGEIPADCPLEDASGRTMEQLLIDNKKLSQEVAKLRQGIRRRRG